MKNTNHSSFPFFGKKNAFYNKSYSDFDAQNDLEHSFLEHDPLPLMPLDESLDDDFQQFLPEADFVDAQEDNKSNES